MKKSLEINIDEELKRAGNEAHFASKSAIGLAARSAARSAERSSKSAARSAYSAYWSAYWSASAAEKLKQIEIIKEMI